MSLFQRRHKGAQAPGAAIQVQDIVKRFGDFEAVKGISLAVRSPGVSCVGSS